MRTVAGVFRNWWLRSRARLRLELDPWLCLGAGGLLLLGLLMVLNTTYFLDREKTGSGFRFFVLQLRHVALGLGLALALSRFSLRGLKRLALAGLAGSALLMAALWVPGLGLVRGGARRWLKLGPVVVEPCEFAKLGLVLFLADFLSRREERLADFKATALPALALAVPLVVAVFRQPDFGDAVILVLLCLTMLFVAGVPLLQVGGLTGAAASVLLFELARKAYRRRRLAAFLDPWRLARGAGFQLIQSDIALGAGGLFGVGLGASQQKMFYLPQAHSDFVFAVIVEEFGLAGAVAVLALFAAIAGRGMQVARREPQAFASLLAAGLTALLSLQAIINIAVVIGLVPTKGLPLPFVSYGGSAVVAAMSALGMLLALARRPAVR
ncbi:MAG: putative lipid II flippase FtsW [Deltaproteobacteria bacterium]|nr:putative lipid II flippase FtsW [Deltaproteobacteria bacterium]